MRRRLFAVGIAMSMVASLSGCVGGGGTNQETTASSQSTVSSTEETTEEKTKESIGDLTYATEDSTENTIETQTEPSIDSTEEETEAPTEAPTEPTVDTKVWRDAYLKVLESEFDLMSEEERAGVAYDVFDCTGDDIPEILMRKGSHADGITLFSYQEDQVERLELGMYSMFIPDANVIWNSDTYFGITGDTIIEYDNGFHRRLTGERGTIEQTKEFYCSLSRVKEDDSEELLAVDTEDVYMEAIGYYIPLEEATSPTFAFNEDGIVKYLMSGEL